MQPNVAITGLRDLADDEAAATRPDFALVREIVAEGKEDAQSLLLRMRDQLEAGRARIRKDFEAGAGAEWVHEQLAHLHDCIIQGALDHAAKRLFKRANPTTGEKLAICAVGGYGRGELAPSSDIDLLFLYGYKRTPFIEQIAEFLLYKLWDLGLKVGQSIRSVAETIKFCRSDLSIRTAILEARLVWGDPDVLEQLQHRYANEIVAGHEPEFIEEKLNERDERHRKLLDSRYLLEPNIKDGKGGLRDLHTLMWIGRFLYGATSPDALAAHGVLTKPSLNTFIVSRRFLWTVRCHLHYLTGRAEERLTFDLQPEIAAKMGFRDRPRSRGVERFMKRYYLVAKDVGSLTRIVCAALEAQHKRRPPISFRRFAFGSRRINGFLVQGGRLSLVDMDIFKERPIAILELFHVAQLRSLHIHPEALRKVRDNLSRIDGRLRGDLMANRLFVDMLTSNKEPALALTRMNEAGVLGRFVPDFGRIVAQMQHNLYHVYTVDEHTIRAIDILYEIEMGQHAEELPLATELAPKLASRRELYVALFLHDLGKGRGRNHSEVGADIARRLCPRLGLNDAETDTVAWLVLNHLLMSHIAFRRDLEDPQTIQDFVAVVQSPERLKLLLVLTAVDIRAVGPSVWNGWKGQLLRELYHEAAAAMASGDPLGRRAARVQHARDSLRKSLEHAGSTEWSPSRVESYIERHDPRYWLGFSQADHKRHAMIIARADDQGAPLTVDFRVDRFRARTELLLYAGDHPGLFMKLAGALAISGVSIVDAHIFTTNDGMALDILGFQDAQGQGAVDEPDRLAKIASNLEHALGGEIWLEKLLEGRRSLPRRADVFRVEPRVFVDNKASRTHSVIEVNGRDRPGLLFDLATALKDLGLMIYSAHISTYGERVVDVFYVKDVFGMKIMARNKLGRIERRLMEALNEG